MAEKILYITSSKLEKMMNNERWHLIKAFKKAGHYVVDVEKDNMHGFDLPKLVKSFKKPIGLIIFEEIIWAKKLKFRIDFKNAHKVKIPKAMFISDFWIYTYKYKRILPKNDIRVLLTCHEGAYAYIGKHFGKWVDRIIWVPLTIDSSHFKFPKQKKKYDFFLSGAMTFFTPFRGRVIELIKKHRSDKYRIYHLGHPGHWKKGENKGVRGIDYYKLLAQSYFCLSTTGINNISARKYWEISAAGSTLLGNETGLPEHFLIKDNLVHIHDQMSDKEILKEIDKAYKNRKKWSKKAEEAQKQVLKFISTDYTVQRLEEQLPILKLPLAQPSRLLRRLRERVGGFIYFKIFRR
jgi:hypothetical protein